MNSKQFNQAAEIVKKLRQKPAQEELLQLYGLFKQATIGDNNKEKPGMFSFTEGYKWDAWNNNKGKNKEIAEEEYIILVNSLLKKYKLKKNK